MFVIDRTGSHATDELIISPQLMPLREILAGKGLTPINRTPGDDRVIIESWL